MSRIDQRLRRLEASVDDVDRAVRIVFRRVGAPFDAADAEPRFPGEQVVSVRFVKAGEAPNVRT